MMIGWMMDKHKLIYVESSRVNELMSKARIGIVELCECKYTSVQLYS